MNTHVFSEHTSNLAQFGTILILGIGIGLMSAMYSPLFSVAGTLLFALFAIALYVNSVNPKVQRVIEAETTYELFAMKSKTLFFLFLMAFFLSITFPKSGRTMSNVPITTANVVILIALVYWMMNLLFSENIIFRVPVSKPLLLFIVYGITAVLIGLANGNHRKVILLDFVAFIGFIPVYLLVCTVIRSKKQLRMLIGLIVISTFFVCTYGILQYRLGFGRVAIPGITQQYDMAEYEGVGKWNTIEGGSQKVYSTFQNGNIFGNHLATFIPFLGGIMLVARSFWKKALFAGVFMLAWYALILTYSRGALLGTVSGFLFLALVSKKPE